jgi:hypothetical protein
MGKSRKQPGGQYYREERLVKLNQMKRQAKFVRDDEEEDTEDKDVEFTGRNQEISTSSTEDD